MNAKDYEIARPGKPPLTIQTLRQAMQPDLHFVQTDCGKEFLIDKKLLVDARRDNPNRLRAKGTPQPTTVFEIRTGQPDQPRDEWSILASETDLEKAKVTLQWHKENSALGAGEVIAMRKNTQLVVSYDFHEWAKERTDNGEWEFPEWTTSGWVKPEFAHHFLHLSVGSPGSVAYWPSIEDAQLDKVVVLNAGSYLGKNYSDVLSAQEICEIVCAADPPGELLFSGKDGDAIASFYTGGGIASCMSGKFRNRREHPTYVYGGGDLEVVQLIRHGKVSARALCWPERKVAGRMYGDHSRLRLALELNGFTVDGGTGSGWDNEGEGGFEGARILKVKEAGSWVMPYIDLGYKVYDDGGDFFRLSKTLGYSSYSTNGTMRSVPLITELEQAA